MVCDIPGSSFVFPAAVANFLIPIPIALALRLRGHGPTGFVPWDVVAPS